MDRFFFFFVTAARFTVSAMRESTTQNASSSGEGKIAGPPESRASRILVPCAVALVYFIAARLGLQFAMPGGHVTPVWPPSGLALAAVLLYGRRVWPGIWLGSFAANLWDFLHAAAPPPLAVSMLTAAGIGAGAALAAWLGAELLHRYAGPEGPLARARNVCAFMGLGGVVSCLFSATNGVTCLALGGFAPWSGFGQIWLTWWLGDTAGVFVVTPLLLAWGAQPAFGRRSRWWEAAGCFALLLAATYSVFIANTTALFSGRPFTFVLIPFLVWPALRFGPRGAATAAGLIACVSVWGTIHGSGPFHLDSLNESLLVLELFLSVVSLTALSMAAVVTEQRCVESDRRRVLDELESRVAERTAALDRANAALRASEHRLRTIIETEPECVKIVSPEGRLLEMNAAGLAMLDAARLEELTAHPLLQFVAPEHRPAFAALHQQVMAGGTGTLKFETIGLKGHAPLAGDARRPAARGAGPGDRAPGRDARHHRAQAGGSGAAGERGPLPQGLCGRAAGHCDGQPDGRPVHPCQSGLLRDAGIHRRRVAAADVRRGHPSRSPRRR